MTVKSTDLEGIKRAIVAAIGKYLPLDDCAVFLFGSRAAGRGKHYSDYDVGLCGKKDIPFGVLSKIEEELEDLPVDVELVDFMEVSGNFRKIAIQEIKIWNMPKNGLNLPLKT